MGAHEKFCLRGRGNCLVLFWGLAINRSHLFPQPAVPQPCLCLRSLQRENKQVSLYTVKQMLGGGLVPAVLGSSLAGLPLRAVPFGFCTKVPSTGSFMAQSTSLPGINSLRWFPLWILPNLQCVFTEAFSFSSSVFYLLSLSSILSGRQLCWGPSPVLGGSTAACCLARWVPSAATRMILLLLTGVNLFTEVEPDRTWELYRLPSLAISILVTALPGILKDHLQLFSSKFIFTYIAL